MLDTFSVFFILSLGGALALNLSSKPIRNIFAKTTEKLVLTSLVSATLCIPPITSFDVANARLDVVSAVYAAAEEDDTIDNSRKYITTASGLQYYDVKIGSGLEIAKEGSSVQFQWVLRQSNGYFVDSSKNYGDEPFIYRVGNTKKAIQGIDEGIRGMRSGGIRRMNIPPNLAFIEGVGDDKPGPMPAGYGPRRQIITRLDREVWYFEIKLLKVKN